MIANGLSERRACHILGLHRSTARYQRPPRDDDAELRKQIRGIALAQGRFGYRRITAELRKDGAVINPKRVYRIYSQEILDVRRRFRPNFIVGIGGAAGGLKAYKALLGALPLNTGMSFVIVSHILPTAISQLAEILTRHTEMRVMVASMGMPVLANHVYVSPSNADLLIENFAFKLVFPRTSRNQVDSFFASLAEAMGARAIGIVLSGYDDDGTDGCRLIKAVGGTTFAQDSSADASGMPLWAEASGWVDFVLPPHKIPQELKRLGRAFEK